MIVNGQAQYWVPGMAEQYHGSDFKQPNTFMLNQGGTVFEDVSPMADPAFTLAKQSRGLALADIDGDGDLDALVTNLHDTPDLYRNDSPRQGRHWLKVRTVGTRSNRDGIGARVLAVLPGMTLLREVRSGQSYLSQSDMTIHFGLGMHQTVPQLQVHWPSGAVSRLENVAADQLLLVKEPER